MTLQFFNELVRRLNQVSMLTTAVVALALVVYTVLCFVSVTPWFEFTASFGQETFENAGRYMQCGLTLLLIMFSTYLPTTSKVSLLEMSHRKFHMNMKDVADAYYASHAADRDGVFKLKAEFDSVRERLAYLRDHPKLAGLEPGVLELAAQMSHQSRDLANLYSNENVERAKLFLQQRNEEIDTQMVQIRNAMKECSEIEDWNNRLNELAEPTESMIHDVKARLDNILPKLGLKVTAAEGKITAFSTFRTAEQAQA